MGAAPFTLRCPKCKKGENWRGGSRKSSRDLLRTGNQKRVPRYGRKLDVLLVEVRHLWCGHIFWTNHPSVR